MAIIINVPTKLANCIMKHLEGHRNKYLCQRDKICQRLTYFLLPNAYVKGDISSMSMSKVRKLSVLGCPSSTFKQNK